MHKTTHLFVALLAVAAIAAGCGQDSTSEERPSTDDPSVAGVDNSDGGDSQTPTTTESAPADTSESDMGNMDDDARADDDAQTADADANEPEAPDSVTIGLLYSNSGAGGVLGPPAERALRLAVADINAAGGVLGAEVGIELADTATDPSVGRDGMERLVAAAEVDMVIGVHSSATRVAARPVAEEHDTLYLYASLYEGGECSAVMFNTGEVPAQQLGPSIPAMMERTGGTKWFLLGNDYVWPRQSFEAAKEIIAAAGGEVVGERYVPLGTQEFSDVAVALAASGADLLLPALVGGDAIAFELQAPDFGVGQRDVARLANIYEEGVLGAIGPELAAGMVVALGYVKEVDNAANRAFVERYVSEFGNDFPPNTFAAHVYESALLWAEAANAAGTTDAAAVSAELKGRSIDSVQGTVTLTDSRHLSQPTYLVEIGPAGEQVIVETFASLDPQEDCAL